MAVSFSTMWAQQERFDEDMGRFRDAVASFGCDAIEVSHATSVDGLNALLHEGNPPLSSLHAPVPHRRLSDGRRNSEANLASIDESHRTLAISETRRTIDIASHAGLRYVVVHLGGVEDDRCAEEWELRRLYDGGERGEAFRQAQKTLYEWRAVRAPAYLEVARRSLAELVEYASARGVTLGIESRLNYHEIPHPHEAAALLADYDNDTAGFWYDVGHCEVQSRLGMIDHAAWGPAIGPRIIGSHLHDVKGIVDHRAPGNGTLDWSLVAATLPAAALRVLEIDQREPEELVSGACAFITERGVV